MWMRLLQSGTEAFTEASFVKEAVNMQMPQTAVKPPLQGHVPINSKELFCVSTYTLYVVALVFPFNNLLWHCGSPEFKEKYLFAMYTFLSLLPNTVDFYR